MRRFLPSVSSLQAFDSAARHLNFTRAADELGLTQSGISRQISALEGRLGNRLFERIGSRLVLTELGRSYAGEVQTMLDRLEEISLDVTRGRKASVAILLGTETMFATRWLIPRLPGFLSEKPGVPLELVALDPFAAPDIGRTDLAILRGPGAWPGVRLVELFREQLVVVASPALLEQLGTVEGMNFHRYPTLQNASRRNLWLTWLRAAGLVHGGGPIRGLRLATTELVIHAAVAGLGLAVVPVQFVRTELASGQLAPLLGKPVFSGESYWLMVPDGKADKPGLSDVQAWLLRSARSDGPR